MANSAIYMRDWGKASSATEVSLKHTLTQLSPCSSPTCLVAGGLLCIHAAGQVRWVAEHPAGGLVVMWGGNRLWLTWGWWRRSPECRPVPAGPSPCELPWEMDGEGTESTVRVCVQVVRIVGSTPAGLLLDEGVWTQWGVGGGQGGVRGGGSVEVQDGSPLRCRADGQGRAAGAGARRERGQKGVQVTYVWSHCGPEKKTRTKIGYFKTDLSLFYVSASLHQSPADPIPIQPRSLNSQVFPPL